MNAQKEKRGRKPKVNEDFIEEFFDFYASVEPHYHPMLVPTKIMTKWAKPKLLAAELIEEDADYQVIYRMIRQLIPGKKRFNADKYQDTLDAYLEKYKRIATIASHDLLNMTGEMLKEIKQKLLEDKKLSGKDFVDVAKVHLETLGHIQSEEREDRSEQLEVAKGPKVDNKDVEESARLLDLLKGGSKPQPSPDE